MPIRTCAVLVIVVVACKGKEAPVTTAAAGPGSATATEDGAKQWAVAVADLESGTRMIVNYREHVPAGVTPAGRSQRVNVRCPYAARADGFPERDVLHALQSLEQQLESAAAIRLLSRTGEGAREAVYQTDNAVTFVATAKGAASRLALTCTTEVADDPTWSQWQDTLAQIADTPQK